MFPGTSSQNDMIANLDIVPSTSLLKQWKIKGTFPRGYEEQFKLIQGPIEKWFDQVHLLNKCSFVGHSKGCALAVLAAVQAKQLKRCKNPTVVLFGSPMFDNTVAKEFEKYLKKRIYSFDFYGAPISLMPLLKTVRPLGMQYEQCVHFNVDSFF